MWTIKLKGFIRQVSVSYSQDYDDNGGEDSIKYNKEQDNMNNKDNNDDIFFKIISCHTFSVPRAQAEMNDYGEYDKATRTSRSENDDNNFFFKSIRCHTFSKLQAQYEVNGDNKIFM